MHDHTTEQSSQKIYEAYCIDCGKRHATKWRMTIRKRENYLCHSCACKRREKAKWNRPETLICRGCGKEFPILRLNGGTRRIVKYCSPECRSATQTVTKLCPACQKEFTVSKSTAERYNYCSVECRHSVNPVVWLTCERCGKQFRGPKGRSERVRRHCSEECRRPPHIVTCDNCGKSYRAVPSYLKNSLNHFCSFRCYRRFTGESSLERKVRLLLESYNVRYQREYAITPKTVYDFYLPDANLLLDVDGDYWHSAEAIKQRDAKKDERAQRRGYHTVRVPEHTVNSDLQATWLTNILVKHGLAVPLQLTLPILHALQD